jgi:hypothetical protein
MRERVGHGGVGRSGIERRGIGRGDGEQVGDVSSGRLGAWLSGGRPPGERPAPGGRGGPARPRGWRVARRRGAGPRPVRPGVVAATVRPPEVPRPFGAPARSSAEAWMPAADRWASSRRSGPCAVRRAGRRRLRRVVAGVTLVVVSAAAVVALGLLARVAEPPAAAVSPAPLSVVRPPAPVVVTVEPGETVWEVADRVAPGSSGSARAELAERIVADNGLGSGRPEPGRVLRVAAG